MSFFSKDKSYSLNAIIFFFGLTLNAIIKTSSSQSRVQPHQLDVLIVLPITHTLYQFSFLSYYYFFFFLILLLLLFLFFLSFLFMPIQTISFTTETTLNPNQRTFGTFSILWESFEKSSKKMFSQPNYPPKESLSIGLILLI